MIVNYTAESKSVAINNDNYIATRPADAKEYTSCFLCLYCGKNKDLPVFKDKLLCAKYLEEIAIVKGAGTCDSVKAKHRWFNFINPIKKYILERGGFDFNAR